MPSEDIRVQLINGQVITLRTVEDDIPTFYANNATFNLGEWDIRCDLSEIQGVLPGQKPEEPITLISKKARLVMPIGYAKRFAQTLLRQVERYEAVEKQLGHPSEDELISVVAPPTPTEEPSKS